MLLALVAGCWIGGGGGGGGIKGKVRKAKMVGWDGWDGGGGRVSGGVGVESGSGAKRVNDFGVNDLGMGMGPVFGLGVGVFGGAGMDGYLVGLMMCCVFSRTRGRTSSLPISFSVIAIEGTGIEP